MEYWLPLFFAGAMGLSLLIYVILDGYDLGVGLLLPFADDQEKDIMIASIGPFWDANETWIVLGVGILLIAFPMAHGIILTSLYIPATLMLMGLILRGISFDFRVKAGEQHKDMWNKAFFIGSLIAATCQGWMLGSYITGLNSGTINIVFSLLIALTLPALYIALGAAWLLCKTEGALFKKAHNWARKSLLPMGAGLILVSIATPLVSETIARKWFSLPNALYLAPIPLLVATLYLRLWQLLYQKNKPIEDRQWHPIAGLIMICLLCTIGLGYSIFPDILMGQMTVWQAAASTKSLTFIFWGAIITLPMIIAYTLYIYKIFHGKASQLSYK